MQPDHLGPYRIVKILGRGGMGAVYEGVHTETDEPAAVKVLSPGLSDEPGFRQRFEAEIETLKRLYHPNIVQLFGFGEDDEQLFYAMELVDGCSLEDEVRQGRMFPWREVARLGIDMCRALRHAHDRGITHRDIKPANLLLTRLDRRIKLSDFGVARLFGNSRLTATGNVLGTAEYMPPEQADARPTGPRSDLYSLGCVFYFLLTRRPPFVARSLIEMLQKHREDQPEPISRLVPDVPPEMESLVAQMLEKDPERRIANATLVARRLESMLKTVSPPLKLPTKQSVDEEEPEFEVLPLGGQPSSPPGKLLETRLVESATSTSLIPEGPTRVTEDLPETKETAAFLVYQPTEGASTAERVATARFVRVAKEELDRSGAERSPRSAIISVQTWILAAALVAVGLGAWYMLRPPSADALYDKIVAMTSDRSIDSLQAAESRIQEFLERFSSDPRAVRLRDYATEIELSRLEKQFELRAKRMTSTDGLLPIERAYLEAINQTQLDPDRGLTKLRALMDLHKDRIDRTGPEGRCVELIRRQEKRLGDQIAKSLPDENAELEERLNRAEHLRLSDPETARGMWRGLIVSYQDKPWAADAVAKARRALAEATAKPPKAPSETAAPQNAPRTHGVDK